MINNDRGTIYGNGDNPFTHSQQQMVMNAFRWLQQQQMNGRGGFETRFDLHKECDLPETPEITVADYQEMYDRNPIAGRVVEVLPEECWGTFPDVFEDDDPDTLTTFEQALKDLGKTLRGEESWYAGDEGNPLWSYCHRADICSGIGHYGLIVLGIDDGKKLDEPVDGFKDYEPGETVGQTFVTNAVKKRKLLFVSVFSESSVMEGGVTYETNPQSPRFRRPKYYQIQLGVEDLRTGTSTRGATSVRVHWSRVIHIPSQLISSDVSGIPLQRPVWNNLIGLRRIYAVDPVAVWKNITGRTWLSTHPQLGGDVTVDEAGLRDMMWNMDNSQQKYGILKGMSAQRDAPSMADPKSHIEVQVDAICMKIPIPKRVFMGSERGELASGQDDDSWNDVVRGKRTKRCIPYITIPLLDRLIQMGVLPIPPKGYFVDWEDPSEMKPMEQADLAVKQADALTKYIAGQVSSIIDPLDFLIRILRFDEEEATEILERAQEGSGGGSEEAPPPAVDEQGNPTPPTDPATGQPATPVEETRLNGAQITAAKDILLSVSAGGTPASVATELLVAVGINRNLATKMVGDASKHSIDAKKADVLESDTPTEKSAKKKPEEKTQEDQLTDNVFCPTGEGGGVDATCSPGGTRVTGRGEVLHLAERGSDKVWRVDGEPAPPHIQSIPIPPAYKDVHVNLDPKATLFVQATNKKGQIVSTYSDSHNAKAEAAKFGRVRELRKKRAEIFKEVDQDAKDPKLKEEAECLKLVLKTGIRPGGTETGADHVSYGATTLKGSHVHVDSSGAVFLKFVPGKSHGVEKTYPIKDASTAKMLQRRAKKAGPDGELFDTNPQSLRNYSKGRDGGGFKTKDHRTALGTETAIAAIKKLGTRKKFTSQKEYKAAVKQVAVEVSNTLGNTPAVALKAYIDPIVFAGWKPPKGK